MPTFDAARVSSAVCRCKRAAQCAYRQLVETRWTDRAKSFDGAESWTRSNVARESRTCMFLRDSGKVLLIGIAGGVFGGTACRGSCTASSTAWSVSTRGGRDADQRIAVFDCCSVRRHTGSPFTE